MNRCRFGEMKWCENPKVTRGLTKWPTQTSTRPLDSLVSLAAEGRELFVLWRHCSKLQFDNHQTPWIATCLHIHFHSQMPADASSSFYGCLYWESLWNPLVVTLERCHKAWRTNCLWWKGLNWTNCPTISSGSRSLSLSLSLKLVNL